MSLTSVLLEETDGIATVTLNRPEKLNAYTTEMGDEVTHVLRTLRDDDSIRVVILTGAGRAFCAGVDLEHLKSHQQGENASRGPRLGEEDFLQKLPLEMLEYPKPLIAAINGHAIGVGMTMVMPCDIRVAAKDAKLGFVFTRLGILPGLGSTHLLPNLVGMARAQELVLTGKKILGVEAAEIGLVNLTVASDEVLPRAIEMAQQMAEIDPIVLRHAKRALHFGARHSMSEAMANERAASMALKDEASGRS
ncbi:MAG: enoyl-CoA hydratase/isomerase family protein [Myxococcales bacterium]|nr:enoyl-CoA hydratase/isomerase family protein [Myxococcales bacterium]HIM02361.1 enoyl-CoA hydratase/isomerase family protein [Myxococcales bacterium]